jgi:hypothetical protein
MFGGVSLISRRLVLVFFFSNFFFLACVQVRARLVIDGTGLGIGLLRYLKVVKGITSLGKAYFPETTASASIVNAPWVFAKLYAVVSPLLTPLMRQKVRGCVC